MLMLGKKENQQGRFRIVVAILVLLAFGLRAFYVFHTQVEFPIRGDSNQYTLYAWNLTHSGVFSSTLPSADTPVIADGYRGPGYPVVLAILMKLAGNANLALVEAGSGHLELVATPATWVNYAYWLQALLGALSVLLTIAIARNWLDNRITLVVGLLVALWPHSVAFSGVLLSETLFGFVLLLALWLTCVALQKRSAACIALAGLVYAAAYLVNPVIALFPILAAGGLVVYKRPRFAVLLTLFYAIGPCAWAVRNSLLPEQAGSALLRAEQNFVQGSWPEYLVAFNARFSNDIAKSIVAAEAEEEQALSSDPRAGLAMIYQRMALDPAYYLSWYLLRKPFLLWDWSVRVGWGDIYFLPVKNSPYDQIAILGGSKKIIAFLNPVFFALAVVGTLLCIRRPEVPGRYVIGLMALLFVYVTMLHTLLQAEPRYSIPFRPEQLLLAGAALASSQGWFMRFRKRFAASEATSA